ncbi:MAG: glycoside hydrolase family 25 protein [Ruminococcus sp.]|nr:glycoside hydrolase family 25 protein [Ruminococcus sp.]
MKNGIDVSRWQSQINWSAVNTDFAIIQAGFGRETSQKDLQFEANYNGCKSRNIPCGAYWYSYANSPEDAEKEANTCLEIIKGKKFEYPIYYDVEEQAVLNLGKARVSVIIRAFLKKVENAGYFVGLYMSASHLNNFVEDDIKNRYAVWVAHYGVSKPTYSGNYGIWQKSSTGKISGINGNVDLNESYIDYPTVIKSAGLNGFPKPEKADEKAANPVQKTKEIEIKIDGETYTGTLIKK